MLPTVNAIALESPTATTPLPQLEVVEFSDFIFLLAQLWGLDIDSIKQHWVCNLFAAGLGEHGRDVRFIIHWMHPKSFMLISVHNFQYPLCLLHV